MPEILIPVFIYLFIILFISSESGFFVGFFVPGDSILFSAGLLASAGYVQISLVLILAFVFALVGDVFGYLYGRKKGKSLLAHKECYWFQKKYQERAITMYKKHGPQTIIIGRFLPVVRSFMPAIAGASKLDIGMFLMHSLVGILFWVSVHAGGGFLLGKLISDLHDSLIIIIGSVIAISIAPNILEFAKDKKAHKECIIHAKQSFKNLASKKHYHPIRDIFRTS